MSETFEVFESDYPTLIKKAYELSSPRGMGQLHYRPGELDNETVADIIENGVTGKIAMDYVHGRAVKLIVAREDWLDETSPLVIRSPWYDHTEDDFQALKEAILDARE